MPLVTRGAPDDPMCPCSHPRASGLLGPWSSRGLLVVGGAGRMGAPDHLGAPSRLGSPRVTWGPFESRWPPPGRNSGYLPGSSGNRFVERPQGRQLEEAYTIFCLGSQMIRYQSFREGHISKDPPLESVPKDRPHLVPTSE